MDPCGPVERAIDHAEFNDVRARVRGSVKKDRISQVLCQPQAEAFLHAKWGRSLRGLVQLDAQVAKFSRRRIQW